LLVIDGDYLAHRSYHALPKTIRRDGGRSAGVRDGVASWRDATPCASRYLGPGPDWTE
jgi:hypothetical protein